MLLLEGFAFEITRLFLFDGLFSIVAMGWLGTTILPSTSELCKISSLVWEVLMIFDGHSRKCSQQCAEGWWVNFRGCLIIKLGLRPLQRTVAFCSCKHHGSIVYTPFLATRSTICSFFCHKTARDIFNIFMLAPSRFTSEGGKDTHEETLSAYESPRSIEKEGGQLWLWQWWHRFW